MTQQRLHRMTRRGLLAAAGAVAAAAPAFATPTPGFPLSLAVARMGPEGLARVPSEHQLIWQAFSTRLGGLVDTVEPVQPSSLVDLAAPEDDGGANTAERACGLAGRLGCSHLILYATADGVRRDPNASQRWLNRAFDAVRQQVQVNDRCMGEAHLLDISGGSPLASATADVNPVWISDLVTGRNAETETLKTLTHDMERRVQLLARAQFAANRSIAD